MSRDLHYTVRVSCPGLLTLIMISMIYLQTLCTPVTNEPKRTKEHPAVMTQRHERLGPDKARFMTPHISEDWRQ